MSDDQGRNPPKPHHKTPPSVAGQDFATSKIASPRTDERADVHSEKITEKFVQEPSEDMSHASTPKRAAATARADRPERSSRSDTSITLPKVHPAWRDVAALFAASDALEGVIGADYIRLFLMEKAICRLRGADVLMQASDEKIVQVSARGKASQANDKIKKEAGL